MKFVFRNANYGFFTEFSYETQKTHVATVETTQETTQETVQKILQLLKADPKINRKKIAEALGTITEDGVKYHLNKLIKEKYIKRVGPDKGGHWEVLQ